MPRDDVSARRGGEGIEGESDSLRSGWSRAQSIKLKLYRAFFLSTGPSVSHSLNTPSRQAASKKLQRQQQENDDGARFKISGIQKNPRCSRLSDSESRKATNQAFAAAAR